MELAHEDLAVQLMGLALEHPLMNAAGTCKFVDDVKQLSRASTSAIMVGSITIQERAGNSGNVYVAGPVFSLNSLGMPNPGASYYEKHLPAMAALAHDAGKRLLVSVAGFTPHEYGELAALAFDRGSDAVELNLGCPNVWQEGQQKPIACFDPLLVAEILRCVDLRVGSEARVAVKISPFSDPFALGEVARVIEQHSVAKAVTTTNTFPNAFAFDGAGQPMISPGGGLAGFAGPALKPIGLGQVIQLRSLLPERIQIIGVGGVSHGRDVLEYLRAGAIAVQIATAYLERYERVFSTLLAELIEVTVG
ncbi:MAG: dihydroorotate dehydrogenase [Dehalococcoidia bacterium]|nr:dihydroorotate dehydrogenase [Dehalococcoidia bacterium]